MFQSRFVCSHNEAMPSTRLLTIDCMDFKELGSNSIWMYLVGDQIRID